MSGWVCWYVCVGSERVSGLVCLCVYPGSEMRGWVVEYVWDWLSVGILIAALEASDQQNKINTHTHKEEKVSFCMSVRQTLISQILPSYKKKVKKVCTCYSLNPSLLKFDHFHLNVSFHWYHLYHHSFSMISSSPFLPTSLNFRKSLGLPNCAYLMFRLGCTTTNSTESWWDRDDSHHFLIYPEKPVSPFLCWFEWNLDSSFFNCPQPGRYPPP